MRREGEAEPDTNGALFAGRYYQIARAVAFLGAPTIISLFLVYALSTRVDRELQERSREHDQIMDMMRSHEAAEETLLERLNVAMRSVCLLNARELRDYDACMDVTATESLQRLSQRRQEQYERLRAQEKARQEESKKPAPPAFGR